MAVRYILRHLVVQWYFELHVWVYVFWHVAVDICCVYRSLCRGIAHMTGEIPASLGQLSHLAILNLCGNQLSGVLLDCYSIIHGLLFIRLLFVIPSQVFCRYRWCVCFRPCD